MIKARTLTVLVTAVLLGMTAQEALARGRMYHPGLGVFMQRDPVGMDPQPAPTISVQSVARNISSPEFTQRDPEIVDSSILPRQPGVQDVMQMARVSAAVKMSDQIGIIPLMQNSRLLQYANGMNLYAYLGLNPINATDPSGLDRYIASDSATHLHLYIVVDQWEWYAKGCCWRTNGTRRYDFSAQDYGWAGFIVLNLDSVIWGPGMITSEPSTLPESYSTVSSKPWEDMKMDVLLTEQMNCPPMYSLLFFNCRHWAHKNIGLGIGTPAPSDPKKRKVCGQGE